MNESDVSGKNVLLIMPRFHNHDVYICETLKKWGANVFSVEENVRTTKNFYKIIWHLSKKLGYLMLDHYYNCRLKNINEIDIVLIIKGESISKKTIQNICRRYPKSKKLLYEWDGVLINPQSLVIADYFDVVVSFDPIDAAQYGWKYRPLFFEKRKKMVDCKEKKYDISFIGTLHTRRIHVLQQAKIQTAKENLRFYGYLYSNFLTYYIRKLVKRDAAFQGKNISEIHHKPLPLEETIKVYYSSKVVLDYAAPGQNGLTMRTIEALCNGCKLLTNNKNVRNISLYREENVAFYDEDSLKIPEDFCNIPPVPVEEKIIEYYTLEYWLRELFDYLG